MAWITMEIMEEGTWVVETWAVEIWVEGSKKTAILFVLVEKVSLISLTSHVTRSILILR